MKKFAEDLEKRIMDGGEVEEAEAARIASARGADLYALLPSADRLARRFKGWEVELCGILNAKSGKCPENCSFCAQSAHHKTDVDTYALVTEEAMTCAADEAASISANRFGIVTSGTGVKRGEELDRIVSAVKKIKAAGRISPCASLGIMDEESLRELKEAGLDSYHHNLETARSFFPEICTTHDYEDDVATVLAAKRAGLKTCCGGIFGLGESAAQRAEMGVTLRELGVDSVPINFLMPVPGTKLEGREEMTPQECLAVIAAYRFLLPEATIKVCAGRDRNLGDLSSWIFYAGANGMMVGHYLTTAGRIPDTDLKMVRDLGFTPVAEQTGDPL